jgi:hypothetical protein
MALLGLEGALKHYIIIICGVTHVQLFVGGQLRCAVQHACCGAHGNFGMFMCLPVHKAMDVTGCLNQKERCDSMGTGIHHCHAPLPSLHQH